METKACLITASGSQNRITGANTKPMTQCQQHEKNLSEALSPPRINLLSNSAFKYLRPLGCCIRNKGLGHNQTQTAMGKFTTARLKHAKCDGRAGSNFWPLCTRGGCVAMLGEPAEHSAALRCSSREPHRQALQMKAGLVGGCRRTVQVLSPRPPPAHSGSLCRTTLRQLPGQRATSQQGGTEQQRCS